MTARQSVQFVELDISWCAKRFGETNGAGNCPATIGGDVTAKCFNTRATCPVIGSYATSTVTLRFGEATAIPVGIDAIPNLKAVSFSAAKIDPGESLGERAVLRVSLGEHPHSDTGDGFDKYHTERGIDPFKQGTMWGKFRARQPWLRGAAARWYIGYADQTLADMECRNFIVESFDGPSVDGIYTLVTVDALKMLDGDRAQVPSVSPGRLNAAITDVQTSAVLTPAGIGASSYPASGYLAFGGKEIVSFTRSGDNLTITRGQLGTTAVEHEAADRVQVVKRYSAQDPAVIINDLMTAVGVPSGYIPLAEWQTETGTYLRRNYTATIAEPTPVNTLVRELMQQCGLSIWWDDLAAQIRLRVLRGAATAITIFANDNVMEQTYGRNEQPNKRVSQVWTFYGQRNPLEGQEDNDNYRSVSVVADLANEANYGSPSIRKIYSRWIPGGGLTAAERVGNLYIGRYGTPPRSFSFSVMRDARQNPLLGESYITEWRTEQLADGSAEQVPIQAIKVTPEKAKLLVEAEELQFDNLDPEDLTTRSITVNYDTLDVNIRSMHDELFPTPIPGTIVNFEVSSGIFIGSSSTSTPALQTGSWPTKAVTGNRTSGSPVLTGIANTTDLFIGQRVAGTGIPNGAKILSIVVNTSITLDMNASSGSGTSTALTVSTVILNVTIKGKVYGRGGKGGQGANGSGDVDGADGLPGGKAFKVDYPIFLTDTLGTTAGGGGGGGGGPCRNANDHKGGGGGGGQGELGGNGGASPKSGDAYQGKPGSRTAPGEGGDGYTNNNFFQGPSRDHARRGGNGGAIGQAGQNGVGSSDLDGGNGGAAGASIDGISKVVTVGSAGTRLGAQIN